VIIDGVKYALMVFRWSGFRENEFNTTRLEMEQELVQVDEL